MIGWGILLVVLGAGSLLLPQLGYQFTLMELVDAWQPYAGIAAALIGVVLIVLGMNRRSEDRVEVTAAQAQEPYRQEPPREP